MRVEIIGPRIEDRPLIKNLYVFYRYDLMAFIERGPGSFINEFGTIDGQTSRAHDEAVSGEDIYWQKPGILTPLLIRADGHLAGFALVNDVAHSGLATDFSMAEFFIARKHRRTGVGQAAATAVIATRPGQWDIAVIRRNTGAQAFWRRVAASVAGSAVQELDRNDDLWNGLILRFRVV